MPDIFKFHGYIRFCQPDQKPGAYGSKYKDEIYEYESVKQECPGYGHPLTKLPLEDTLFSVLLANILDNAIEGVLRIPVNQQNEYKGEIVLTLGRNWNNFVSATDNHGYNPR